jgi:hypothetical protein
MLPCRDMLAVIASALASPLAEGAYGPLSHALLAKLLDGHKPQSA